MTSTGLNFISSITSTHIQKIIVTCSFAFQELPVNDTYWTYLDDVQCQLVHRPEYRLRLEVEFLTARPTWVEEPGLKMYLPRFHEKGRVRVVDPGNEGIYFSGHCPGTSGKPQICFFCFSKQNKRKKRGNYEIIKQDPPRSSMKSSVQFS